ncbi:MAG TPA: ABC transporter permease [Lachnospiraceae bacterium]|nr:ABC transporter permease [Lachnospiraceae bacterium]
MVTKSRKGRTISIRYIALKNLKHQSLRSMIVFILLVVTTIALFLGDFLTESMREGIAITSERIGADIIVVPSTFVSSIEDSLFQGKPCTVNFEKEWLGKIGSIKGVKRVSSQLYISSLSSECCDSSMQLIALDMDADFTVAPWLSKGGVKSLKEDEIILGSNMKKGIGDKVKYFGRKFTVVNVLEETGMGYDSCAFISYEAAYQVAKDPIYQNVLPFRSSDQVISMVLLDVEDGYDLSEVKKNIEEKYKGSDITVYSTSDLLTKFSDSLENIVIYGNLLRFLFLLLSIVSLYAIFSITTHIRRHEFGSMLSVGVTFRSIIGMLIWEMIYIVIAASVVGIGIVCGIIIPFHAELKSLFTIPYLLPDTVTLLIMSSKTLGINILVCGAASFHTLWKLGKMEPAKLIREENG